MSHPTSGLLEESPPCTYKVWTSLAKDLGWVREGASYQGRSVEEGPSEVRYYNRYTGDTGRLVLYHPPSKEQMPESDSPLYAFFAKEGWMMRVLKKQEALEAKNKNV
jgi:hypothetical protein